MKNIILGILGCMIAVYTIVSCLSIYSISTRKNEMENCISQVLKYHLNRYYATGVSDTEVEAFVRQEIRQQFNRLLGTLQYFFSHVAFVRKNPYCFGFVEHHKVGQEDCCCGRLAQLAW